MKMFVGGVVNEPPLPHSKDHVPVGRVIGPGPLNVRNAVNMPLDAPVLVVPFPKPSQVTGPGTVIVRVVFDPVPAVNMGNSPLVKMNVEPERVALLVQFVVVVSQTPPVAMDVPLLSQSTLT